jgi:L-rhamnose-H+ transport protein
MSAFMAYAFAAGKPIAQVALDNGAPSLWQNLPVLIVILAGGFVTNFIWCIALALKNGTLGEFVGRVQLDGSEALLVPSKAAPSKAIVLSANILFCAFAGVTWYLQFFFYGMGTTMMGQYEFSSWTLHMASIIVFSTLWGLALREWRGVSNITQRWNTAGLAVLIFSMVVIGWGNTIAIRGAAH